MAARAATPAGGSSGHRRPRRDEVEIDLAPEKCQDKILLLRARVPGMEDAKLHAERLALSITAFAEELSAGAAEDLPADPVSMIHDAKAYYIAKKPNGYYILTAQLVICSALERAVEARLRMGFLDLPAPYGGMVAAKWDKGNPEHEVLILGIPLGVTVEGMGRALAAKGYAVRDLHVEPSNAKLARRDAMRGFFKAGNVPYTIKLRDGTTLRCDIKDPFPDAPSLAPRGPPPAGVPRLVSYAAATANFPPLVPAPALVVGAEQEAASDGGTGLDGSPLESVPLETDVEAAAPAAAQPFLPICGVPAPEAEGGDQASDGVQDASAVRATRSRSPSPVGDQEAAMVECGDGTDEPGRQGRGRSKSSTKTPTLHVVTRSKTKVTKGASATGKASRPQAGASRSNRFEALAQELAPPSQPSDGV